MDFSCTSTTAFGKHKIYAAVFILYAYVTMCCQLVNKPENSLSFADQVAMFIATVSAAPLEIIVPKEQGAVLVVAIIRLVVHR